MLCARIKDLSASAGSHRILNDISLECPDNAITVLAGRSGSGKTTLLRSLNRLNDHFPELVVTGSVELKFGNVMKDVYAPSTSIPELRRRAGMVFQSPNPLPLSVARNILLPLKLTLGVHGSEAEGRMERALHDVGLWQEVSGRLNAQASSLSGGQQQRLCLARTLTLEPDILLLDEPTASLDRRASEIIEELLLSLKAHYPIIMVSHSLPQAQKLASRLVVLRDGEVYRTLDAPEIPHGPDGLSIIEKML